MRLIDDTNPQISIGFLFGRVLPEMGNASPHWQQKITRNQTTLHFRSEMRGEVDSVPDVNAEDEVESDVGPKFTDLHDKGNRLNPSPHGEEPPLVIASILVQDKEMSQQLQVFTATIPVHEYSVNARGRPVTHNPDDRSPPDFSIQFGSSGTFDVSPNQTVRVDVTVGNMKLYIQGSNPEPWGPDGQGPEGWLEHLPLPLHWFVYSLGSDVSAYVLTNVDSGRVLSGTKAHLHMEKNWGESFPSAWIWAQGITVSKVVLALSGGVVDFEKIGLNVTSFLVGYRNPAKGVVINFTPANSVTSFSHNGCVGAVSLNVTGLDHRLAINIGSLPGYMSQCILGPEKNGFKPACVESYGARASVRVYKRVDFHFNEIDRAEMQNVGLEFGGKYVCTTKCSSN